MTPKIDWTTVDLYDLYINKNKTPQEIATLLNVGVSAILFKLNRDCLPSKKKGFAYYYEYLKDEDCGEEDIEEHMRGRML